MYLKIDFDSEKPIYSQLYEQIVEGIAMGDMKEGDALPSVRQMAEDIGINLHTVNKAYSLLKNDGYVKLDRRKGAVINLNFQQTKEAIIERISNEMKSVLAEAFCKGVGSSEIAELVNEIYSKFSKGK